MLGTIRTGAFLAGLVVQAQANGEVGPSLEDQILEAVSSWQAYTACALLAAGIVFAIYGWRISKVLAVINFAAIGGFLGHYLARQVGISELASTVGLAVVLGGGVYGKQGTVCHCWPAEPGLY